MTRRSLMLATTLAGAALPAVAHAGELTLDLADTFVHLGEVRNETDKGIDNRYTVQVKGSVAGPIDTADRVKVEWKANGKTVAAFECDVQGSEGQAPFECHSDEAKPLDFYGDLQAVFTYMDDSDDKATPLYTMNLKVARFWNWYQRGKKTLFYPKYQIDHSDLLGSAIVWHRPFEEPSTLGEIELYTIGVVGEDGGGVWGNETMRCVAAGTKLADVRSGMGGFQLAESLDWRGPDKPQHPVKWQKLVAMPAGFRWGTTAKLNENERAQYDAHEIVVLGDHPGEWSCDLRRKGQVLRTFTFTVGKDGRIADQPEQAAGLRLLKSEAMVAVSFPEEVWDAYFDPVRVKAAGFFGRAWAVPATAAGMKLGEAKGPLELAPPKGAKGGTLAKKAK